MNGNDMSALIITGALGLLLVICSIFLLAGRGSFLIAGFSTMSKTEKEKYDKAALCKFMGKILLPIGILCPCLVISEMLEISWFPVVFVVVVLGLVIFAAIYANTGNRFRK
jgi:hypothetical protein